MPALQRQGGRFLDGSIRSFEDEARRAFRPLGRPSCHPENEQFLLAREVEFLHVRTGPVPTTMDNVTIPRSLGHFSAKLRGNARVARTPAAAGCQRDAV